MYFLYAFGVNVVVVPTHAKLIWNCRRGMLELDLMLARLVETKLSQFDDSQCVLFERLLACTDPDLYAYLMGQDMPEDEELKQFVSYIRTEYSL